MTKEITIEEITAALPIMIRASGWFYMEAARALTEDFGAEGERTVRRWLRRWGQWRGREMRKGHMALGLPINVETLCKNWDSAAATYHLMDEWIKEGSWHPGNVKVPVKKGECLSCHDPHAADVAGLLKARSSDICFNCHTEMQKNYKNTHAPYAKGQCGTCHRPHQSSYPNLLAKEAESLCLGCHPLGSVRQKHRDFPVELGSCGSCHNPHGSDRPALVRNILHEPFAEGCGDCHAGRNIPVLVDTYLECHPEVSEQMASSHNHLVRYEDNGCMACHTPHAGDDKRLLKGKERHICGRCHESTFMRWDSAEFSHQKTDACNNCHAPHGSNHPSMAKAALNQVCSECHGGHGMFAHPIGEDVFDPRTGQMMTCGSCHASKGSDYDYHTRFNRKKALCVQCHAEY